MVAIAIELVLKGRYSLFTVEYCILSTSKESWHVRTTLREIRNKLQKSKLLSALKHVMSPLIDSWWGESGSKGHKTTFLAQVKCSRHSIKQVRLQMANYQVCLWLQSVGKPHFISCTLAISTSQKTTNKSASWLCLFLPLSNSSVASTIKRFSLDARIKETRISEISREERCYWCFDERWVTI